MMELIMFKNQIVPSERYNSSSFLKILMFTITFNFNETLRNVSKNYQSKLKYDISLKCSVF